MVMGGEHGQAPDEADQEAEQAPMMCAAVIMMPACAQGQSMNPPR